MVRGRGKERGEREREEEVRERGGGVVAQQATYVSYKFRNSQLALKFKCSNWLSCQSVQKSRACDFI